MPKGIPGRAVCSVSSCENLASSRGLCGKHYTRWRKHGTVEPHVWRRNDYDPVLGTKHCTGCDQDWPILCWSPDARRGDGLKSRCRACLKAAAAASYAADRARHNARTRQWYAENRERMREYDRRRHNDERRAANRQNYRKNAEVRKEYVRQWQRENPERKAEYLRHRRALQASRSIGVIGAERLAARMAYWGDRCWMCGDVATEVDHVKPLAKGGLHVLSNLRPACKSCNSAKRDRWPLEELTGGALWQSKRAKHSWLSGRT